MTITDVQELALRARQLVRTPPALKGATFEHYYYDHPRFCISLNDDRLRVRLKDPDRSVYWETTQILPHRAPDDFQVNMEYVPELLSILRQIMVLDDLASI